MTDTTHTGLPVKGYKPQTSEAVAIVNENKKIEERILREFDLLAKRGELDKRQHITARAAVKRGFMALCSDLFQTKCVTDL